MLEYIPQYFCLYQGGREILLSLTSKNISMGDQVKGVLLRGFPNIAGNQLSSDTSEMSQVEPATANYSTVLGIGSVVIKHTSYIKQNKRDPKILLNQYSHPQFNCQNRY